jgi:TP901 family phage tail tape measure protein
MAFDAGTLKGYLTLDNKGYTTALNKSQKQTDTFGGYIEKNSAKIKKMGIVMTAAGGLIVAGLGKMISSATKLGDTFNKMSIRTGASTKMLSALRFAAQQSGASLEIVEKGFTRLSKNMFDSTLGLAEAKRGFEALGITVTDNNGELKATDAVFLELAEKFKGMKDGAEKSAIANTIFGRSGVQLIPILNQGKEGIAKLTEEAERLGIVFSTDDAQAAADLTDDMNSLSKSFEGAFKTLSVQMMPILSGIANSITGVITKITAWIKENPELARVLTITTAALGGFMLITGPILIVLPKLVAGFVLVKGAMETLYLRSLYLADSFTGLLSKMSGSFLGKLGLFAAGTYAVVKAWNAIDNVLGLSVKKFTQLSMIKMGWTEQGKQALFLKDNLIELAKKIDPTVTGLRSASRVLKNNKEAYEKLHPRLKRIVDGMTQLRPAIQGVIDKGAEIPAQTKAQREALGSILDASALRIKELTLSETDFKIEQLNREYAENIKFLNKNAATKTQLQTLERAHALEITRIKEEAYLAQKEKDGKRKEEEKKAKEEEFKKEEERQQRHFDFLEGLKKEQQTLVLQQIEERDGWNVAELARLKIWHDEQYKQVQERLDNQLITYQEYEDQRNAIKETGEMKREAIETETRNRLEKEEKEKEERLWQNYESMTNKKQAQMAKYFGFISNLNNVYTALRENSLNTWYDNELRRINESGMSNEERTIAIENLDARMHAKKAALEAQAQKRERAMAIAQAIANTAVAITTALKSLPWPFNLPAIAFAIATGAAQIAAIGGAYKAPGLEIFAPGGGEGSGSEPVGGRGSKESGGRVGGEVPAYQTGTHGYITPPRDFLVGEPYSPERVQLRGNLQGVGMSVTPLGQTAPVHGGTNIHLDFSGMHVIDATDFENRVRDFLPRLMQQFFNNGMVYIPRGRVR